MSSKEETNITKLKQYLLGNLSLPETEAIDLQIISDENSEELFLWAESELMEDYLDETLPATEIGLFNKNFLVSPERRARFEQIALLKNYARNATAKDISGKASETSPENLFGKLKGYFLMNWRPATAVFALLVIGFFGILYFTANKQTASEKEFAALNQKDLSSLAEFKSLPTLSLIGGVYRNSGDLQKMSEPPFGEKVLFRLALPVQSNAPEKFRAELAKDGKTIFTQNQLPFYSNPNGQEIRLLLPSTDLKKGIYQIKLTKENAVESTFAYNFAVE